MFQLVALWLLELLGHVANEVLAEVAHAFIVVDERETGHLVLMLTQDWQLLVLDDVVGYEKANGHWLGLLIIFVAVARVVEVILVHDRVVMYVIVLADTGVVEDLEELL